MSLPEARFPDPTASAAGGPQLIRRHQRLAVVFGLAAILAAALIGWSAYDVSRKALLTGYYEDALERAKAEAEFLVRSGSLTLDPETCASLKRDFEQKESRWEKSYLCLMDESGKLVINTGDPSKQGQSVGLLPFRGEDEDGSGPDNLLQLVREERSWRGRYESLDGRLQMAAFAFVRDFRALVAIHVPWESVEARVDRLTLPWAIGFAFTVLIAVPFALWGLSKAYADSERAAQRARDAERRAAENVRTLREIDRAILAGGTTREIVHAAFANMGNLIRYRGASVVLFEHERGLGRIFAVQSSVETAFGEDVLVPLDALGLEIFEDLRAGRPILVPDLDAREPLSEVMRRVRSEGVRSLVIVPMLCRGTLLGSLNLGYEEPGSPSEEDVEVAREVADVLALAVHQAALHEELRRQAAELEERVAERTRELSEVNAELEGYVHSVSHDLRAPLRAVRGFGNLLMEEAGARLGPNEREYLERMVSASERMDTLMRDLLAYSRLAREDLAVRPLDTRLAVQEAQDLLQVEIEERRAEIEIVEPLRPVLGHHSSLVQAVANLLSNAAKFVANGVPPRIRIQTQARGRMVRLWVEDNGIGVAPEDHEKIFRVFERLNGVKFYPGTGIGLAIVRRAAVRMGGSVGVESRKGKGSRFWIELPAARDAS